MKKAITQRLAILFLMTTLVVLVLNIFIQVGIARRNQDESARTALREIKNIVLWNSQVLSLVEDTKETAAQIRCQAAAHILEYELSSYDLESLAEVADLLRLDELHVLDAGGTIISGTVPAYYGASLADIKQMQDLLPILEDKSLVLSQTADVSSSEIWYTAAWQENGEYLILIGLSLNQLSTVKSANDLSNIFSMLPVTDTVLYAIDADTGMIAASTDASLTGLPQSEIGLDLTGEGLLDTGFTATVNGVSCYCYFESYDNMIIGATVSNQVLYQAAAGSIILISLCMMAAVGLALAFILWYIDRRVIRDINDIIDKLSQITHGNLDTQVNVRSVPEFAELSTHINRMVNSLLNTTNKLSKIFDMASIPVGVYEYHADMKRVMSTRKVQTMLMLHEEEYNRLTADKSLFEAYMAKLCSHPHPQYPDVYEIPADTAYYLRILPYTEDGTTICILSDVTEDVLEKQQLEHDRDYDVLTGLLNRRAYYAQMKQLFTGEKTFAAGAMMAFDMDGLKQINDTFGHVIGDKAIQAAASIFQQCPTERKVTARLGGDEFSVFLYGDTKEELEQLIQEMHSTMLRTSITVSEHTKYPIRLSGGYLFYPDYDLGYSQMLHLADLALYYSKMRRMGEFHCYTPDTSPLEAS